MWSKPAAKKPIPSNENDPILLEGLQIVSNFFINSFLDSDNEEFYSAKKPKTTWFLRYYLFFLWSHCVNKNGFSNKVLLHFETLIMHLRNDA